jgi:hypothetical protein
MRARASILLSVVAVVLVVGSGTAAAHGDEGEMSVTRLEQVGPTTVEVEVGIVYEGDGHLAEDAQVSATLAGPGGASVGPVQLERTGEATSLYVATVEVPAVGEWTATVTSSEPTAEASQAVTVAEQAPATTKAPATTVADASTTTTEAPAEVDAEPVTATQSAEDEESSSNLALLVGASLVLAVIVIGGAVLVARQRAAKDAADGDS